MRTSYPFAKAFACAGVIYVVGTVLLLVVLMSQVPHNATPYQIGFMTGRAIGAFLLASIVPAFITGLIVRLSLRVWPLWQVALTFLPMFFLVAALQLAGTAIR
jgi:hypothetical protein